jgi:hypothetical protein
MTQAGEIANFNARYGECEPLNPNQDDRRWTDPEKPRLLTERFLLDILGNTEFAAALPPRGVRVIGERFASGVDLAGIDVARQLALESSRFDDSVRFTDATFEKFLTFEGSTFKGAFDLRGISIGRDLRLKRQHLLDLFRSGTLI